MARKLIYIHGFNSSERSHKAVQLGEHLRTWQGQYIVPRLSHDPEQAIAHLSALVDEDTALIGSSLGGFYATYLSQRYHLPSVVINPAVRPFELLDEYRGVQYNPYQNYSYELNHIHMQALQGLYLQQLTSPELLFLLQQEGDEVLPYEQAVAYYQGCKQQVEAGGNHSFIGFERYFTHIMQFLNISLTTKAVNE